MRSLLTLGQEAARKSAEIALSYYGDSTFTTKSDSSPLTEADTRIHDYLMETLGVSGIPVLSEEGAHDYASPQGELWIIDPIDGTQGFINGTGDFAIMIGLLDKAGPLLGIIDVPVTNTQYYALRGEGSFKVVDGVTEKLMVSDRTIPELRAVQSRNHAAPYMKSVNAALEVTECVSVGGIGIKASLLVENKGDYFLTLGNLGEWDVCAPEIIVREAGGRVSDRNGDPLQYHNADGRIRNGVVCSNSVCHREVLTALSLATRINLPE